MKNSLLMESSFSEYLNEENHDFYVRSSEIEALGYCEWPRLREIMEFSRMMGYRHLGLAFCRGLSEEARITCRILRQNGFLVSSVICKAGGIDKTEAGISAKVHEGEFESMCNPVAQARFLEDAGTEFNITLGLCVGHDSLFYKYSHVNATAFAVKDRVTGHNPLSCIYLSRGYMRKRLEMSDGKA